MRKKRETLYYATDKMKNFIHSCTESYRNSGPKLEHSNRYGDDKAMFLTLEPKVRREINKTLYGINTAQYIPPTGNE